MSRDIKPLLREFRRLFVPLALAILAAAALFAWLGLRIETRRELERERAGADVASASVTQAIAPLMRHLASLASEAPVRAAIDTPGPATLDGMVGAFVSLLHRNPDYAQARWIDATGRERVRVDMTAAGPVRIEEAQLQAKSIRPYVHDALKLAVGATYLSEFDLNVEHDVIEQPPRPMLRAAVRVEGGADHSAGLLVINLEGRAVLQALDFLQERGPTQRLLVNWRGDFLRGLEPKDEFGFMFGRKVTLADRAPAVWAQMQQNRAGATIDDGALWAWQSIDPNPALGPPDGRVNATPWFVVTRQSDGLLRKARMDIAALVASVAALVLLISAALVWRIAREKASLAEARLVAESAARSKADFLANMSHEIRTPINAIVGLTHLIKRDTADPLQRERLATVDSAAKHLLQVLNDILDLSKIDAGKMVLESLDFSLDQLTKSALDLVADRAREKGLELVLDTHSVPDRLNGDPTRLSQAMINLLSNAVKFTARGWVRLSVALISDRGDRLLLRFEVRDTGEGIAPDQRTRLFDAFEQADTSTTRRHGGTGLGLALTRHFAQMMGGEVGVDSQVGTGSTFWFSAWVGRAAALAHAPTPPIQRGQRVLLVDDLPEARAALADRLKALGMEVDEQASGEAAIARVRAETASGRAYGAMLIDWQMDSMDGLETARALRILLGEAMPPCVLVTAFDQPTLRDQARRAGYASVLIKPVSTSTLHDALVTLQGPAVREPAPVPSSQAYELQLRQEFAGRRVLLAEDNPVNQEVASELLRICGLVVELAGNGSIAVDMAVAQPYDLVLMDVQMPEMDGLAATRALRGRAGGTMPIIAMTANAFGEDRAACLDAGMDDHIAKPVDPATLYATVLRWLRASNGPAPLPAPTAANVGAASSRTPLLDRLGGVAGFDAALGLRNVGRQPPVLERVLRRFVATYPGGAPELCRLDSAQDLARARATSHSLRSACGTIGAVALAADVAAFEATLKLGALPAVAASQGEAVHTCLLQLVAALEAALGRA